MIWGTLCFIFGKFLSTICVVKSYHNHFEFVHLNQVNEYPVHQIPSDKIVDSNGAGDAFVGGFLSRFVSGQDEKTCVAAGNYAAAYMIQRAGTKLEGVPDFK